MRLNSRLVQLERSHAPAPVIPFDASRRWYGVLALIDRWAEARGHKVATLVVALAALHPYCYNQGRERPDVEEHCRRATDAFRKRWNGGAACDDAGEAVRLCAELDDSVDTLTALLGAGDGK